ncbi:MAG: hypothetical protein KW793_04845, partial [Candidatus Doudnabacteria bacterium]|nr:hypothetical protein [Candidatus Doudnabacteria bacterium]
FFTSSQEQAEWFSTLAHLANRSATVYKKEQGLGSYSTTTMWWVNVKSRSHASVQRKHWKKIQYTGPVYCPQVPSSYWLVRENGFISVTGNTNLQNIEQRLRSVFIADEGMKFAYIDLEQAESRLVGAIEWNLFKDGRYLDACESGDLHTTVCRLAWGDIIRWTGDLRVDRDLAEAPFYRQHSYRHMAKVLGHGCLSGDHEVLTRNGWVPISSKPPVIMTWTDEESFFDVVTHWEDHEYKGEMQSFEGNSISAYMTHDHRVPFKTDAKSKVHEKAAENGPGLLMPLGNGFKGGCISPMARLVAAVMSDGYIMSGKSTQFHFHKQRKKDRLKKLCADYGVKYSESGNKIRIEFVCDKFCGPYMFDWSRQSILDFLDEYKYWDGTQGKTSVTLFSKHRDQLEWIQTLGRLVGIGGQISKPYNTGFGGVCYRLQQNNRSWANGNSIEHKKEFNKLQVYCPTVASGWFYVRRKGKIYVTGNTNYNGKPFTMAKHTKLDQKLIAQFQDRYFAAFPAHRQWHARVAQELYLNGNLTTLTGRRRWFFGRRNDDATIREAIAFDPQGSVGDILNRGMLAVWRLNRIQLLLQIHDAILVQYPAEQETEIIPLLLETIKHPIQLKHDRTLIIPSEAQIGWNWGKYDEQQNPDGLSKWSPSKPDARRRTRPAKAASLMDRFVC